MQAASKEAEEIVRAGREEAEQIMAAAREKSKEILEQARSEGYEKGYEKGFEEGRSAGLAQAKAEMEESISQAQLEAKKIISQAEDIRAQLLDGAEGEVVELAMTIASKVVHSHVAVKQGTIGGRKPWIGPFRHNYFVSPADVELPHNIFQAAQCLSGAGLHFTDRSISQGGCRVELNLDSLT